MRIEITETPDNTDQFQTPQQAEPDYKAAYTQLSEEHGVLGVNYEVLKGYYDSLERRYRSLEDDWTELSAKYTSLFEEYTNTKNQHQAEMDKLENQCVLLTQLLEDISRRASRLEHIADMLDEANNLTEAAEEEIEELELELDEEEDLDEEYPNEDERDERPVYRRYYKVEGYENPMLEFHPGIAECGDITDGVVFSHKGEGGWVVDFEDFKEMFLDALSLRSGLTVDAIRDNFNEALRLGAEQGRWTTHWETTEDEDDDDEMADQFECACCGCYGSPGDEEDEELSAEDKQDILIEALRVAINAYCNRRTQPW
jgi:hypothetical protein